MITHGTLDIRTDVAGGITAAMITGGADNRDSITVTATQNQINATLGNATGLTFTPPANFNGNPSFAIITNDLGMNGNDPGMTGSGTSEEDADGWVVNIAAVDDPGVAQPDAVGTDEASLSAGNLFADHGSGPDTDVDGPSISAVNGSAANMGAQITLASGALLTVNADGSYSYDPNDEFNHLVSAGTGAVNTTAVDSFTYTLAGGNTVAVTVTIAGITNVGDVIAGGPGNDNLLGTETKDVFVGYGGADTMTGFGGKDVYHVDSLDDQVIEAVDGGRDQVRTNLSTYTLPDNVEAILGRAGDQVLTGNALDNIMEGGAGADVMIGLAGNDLYSVDNVGDMVVWSSTRVSTRSGASSASRSARMFEDLVLNGVGDIDGTGNELANRITGNGANNVLDGKAGADKMAGGVGDDTYIVDHVDDRVTEFADEDRQRRQFGRYHPRVGRRESDAQRGRHRGYR